MRPVGMAGSWWRRVRVVVVVLALPASVMGACFGLHAVLHPWSMTLPGAWMGTATFGPGDERVVAMTLVSYPGQGRGDSDLDGEAVVCGPAGTMRYRVYGYVPDRDGRRMTLDLDEETQGEGLYLGTMKGAWDGADEMVFRTPLRLFGPDGVADSAVPDPPPITVTLRRATDDAVETACAR